jgi:hypothetical protein
VHAAHIDALAAAGVTKGCNPPANTLFCPDRITTRAEMASFLVRVLGLRPASSQPFIDVASSVHRDDIASLAESGITKGCNPPTNDKFCPNSHVTRGQMAAFLTRALKLPAAPTDYFVDDAGSVFENDINRLAASGITKGCNPPTNDRYCPDAAVNRAQTASFLVRSLPAVSPIFNQLSLVTGVFCSKDGESCRRSFTAASGMRWEITDGWYNVVPFLPGEEAVFEAGDTRLELELNGIPVGVTELGQTQSGALVKRLFTAVLDPIGRGSNTIVARWRWNGTVVRTLTIRISA